jgi:hypothetical protein
MSNRSYSLLGILSNWLRGNKHPVLTDKEKQARAEFPVGTVLELSESLCSELPVTTHLPSPVYGKVEAASMDSGKSCSGCILGIDRGGCLSSFVCIKSNRADKTNVVLKLCNKSGELI